jgi:hypothetical protein
VNNDFDVIISVPIERQPTSLAGLTTIKGNTARQSHTSGPNAMIRISNALAKPVILKNNESVGTGAIPVAVSNSTNIQHDEWAQDGTLDWIPSCGRGFGEAARRQRTPSRRIYLEVVPVYAQGTTYVHQRFMTLAGSVAMYVRNNAGTWGAWKQVTLV